MPDTSPPKTPHRVDLTNCDREPIHIPGSIQPHGALLAFDDGAKAVLRRSDNAADLLGFTDGDLIGKSLTDFCTPTAAHDIANALAQARMATKPGLLLGVELKNNQRFDIAAHRYKGAAILELERAPADGGGNPLQTFRLLISAISHIANVDELLQATPRLLRGVLGYDRVMLYRFAQDESGKVVAESKRSDLEGFLGQHFPGGDIPQQARLLYLKNTIRIISDSRGDKSDIHPVLDASGEPLDLSFAHLRSVSPIHLEYLRNMGVSASMSISIIVEGKLWGLIACHHYAPRVLSMAQRVAAELFGEYFSLQLEALTHRTRLDAASRARRTLDRVMRDVSYHHSDIALSLREKLGDMRELLPCDGVGLWLDGAWTYAGVAPPRNAVEPLMQFISTVADGKIWGSHEVSAAFAPAARYSDTVAGVLAIPLSQQPRDYLVYFRRELVQTLEWGGDPNKVYTTGPMGDRLTPRKSFAIWKQTVERQSQPWTDDDREMAEAARSALLEVIMRHTEILESERQTASVRQKLLNEELNHRVKNILALIKSLVSLPRGDTSDLAKYVDSLRGRINALAFAHDQVMRSDGGGTLRSLLEAELSAYQNNGSAMQLNGPNTSLDARAYSVMALVIHELTTNAAKYGALSRAGGSLKVTWAFKPDGACEVFWKESGGPRVTPPSRQGFGSTLISRSVPFDLKGESQVSYEPDGLAARILLPAQFVAADRLQEARGDAKKDAGGGSARSLKDLRILLLEDQLIIAMDAESSLLDSGARSVDAVGTAEDALRLLGAITPDACVLDVNLGNGTSIPVADELTRRGIPFIFATGYADRTVIPAHYAGVPTVRKPYDTASLCDAIVKALGATS